MKKLLVALCITCALAVAAHADDKDKGDKKGLHKQMLEKYDANKDGKLDKEEKAKMSTEDKEKMEKARDGKDGKGKGKKKKE